jgi:hypothetical protein
VAQMQTISIRVPDDDFQWLLSLPDASGKTPSEKLRALLARSRQQAAGMTDPELCAAWQRALIQPFLDSVNALERRQKMHSDLVGAVADCIPQLMTTLISSPIGAENAEREAVEVEAVLAQQCFRLLTTLLRAAVTSVPATYDKNVLERYLPNIIEIASIISTRKGKEQ